MSWCGCASDASGGSETRRVPASATTHVIDENSACLLDVPTNKTGTSYTKPVDPLVGEAIAAWEQARPIQPNLFDRKTGESVAMLFCFRGQPIPTEYFNRALIPLLCARQACHSEMLEAALPATGRERPSPPSCSTPRSP